MRSIARRVGQALLLIGLLLTVGTQISQVAAQDPTVIPFQNCDTNGVGKPYGMCIFDGGLTLTGAPSLDTTFVVQSGKVGIGTASPAEQLHVVGDIRFECSNRCIAGFGGNSVLPGVVGATIAGGGQVGAPNRVATDFGTVGGGFGNEARHVATVGGGEGNIATGDQSTIGGGVSNRTSSIAATVGGGAGNAADGRASTVGGGGGNSAGCGFFCTVSGGTNNSAGGDASTVSGGEDNVAGGNFSTVSGGRTNLADSIGSMVPGGLENTAAGFLSLAAGLRAKANHNGAFVWADCGPCDGSGAGFSSTAPNQFNVRASGGTRIFSNTLATVGVQLAPGSNAWGILSDHNVKENFVPVEERLILQKLSLIPITMWNLKSQDPSIKHIGLMAQDFYAAFGLGESDRYINSSDADGIAFISIQALYQLSLERDEQIEQLREQNAQLRARLETLEQEVQELKEAIQQK